MLIRKRNDKSARIVAFLGSFSLPLAFAGALGRTMKTVELEEPNAAEFLRPVFGFVGTVCLVLSVISLICALFFYVKYGMLIPCIKSYLIAIGNALAVGLSVFLVGALFTVTFTVFFYGIALVCFPIMFVSKYYGKIDEELAQLGTGLRSSGVVPTPETKKPTNQEDNNMVWEALFASIRNEPLPNFGYTMPFDKPSKGWFVEWEGVLVRTPLQFEILRKEVSELYLEVEETNGVVANVWARITNISGKDISHLFQQKNPLDKMQFIALSPWLAILITGTDNNPYMRNIYKLVRAFPDAPDFVDRTVFDAESAVLETNFLKRLNESGLSEKDQTSLLWNYKAYREIFWLFVKTKHPGLKEKSEKMKKELEDKLVQK